MSKVDKEWNKLVRAVYFVRPKLRLTVVNKTPEGTSVFEVTPDDVLFVEQGDDGWWVYKVAGSVAGELAWWATRYIRSPAEIESHFEVVDQPAQFRSPIRRYR